MPVTMQHVRAALATIAVAGFHAATAHADVAGGPVTLVPHRAIYNLSLERSTAGSGVSNVDGRIVYEITGNACEGYTQNMRFLSFTTSQEGGTQQTDLRTSSWEEVPSKKLRFSSSNYQNDNLAEQSRGSATREGPGLAGNIELVKPGKKSVELPAGARFPVQHSMDLIRAARRGDHVFTSELYDGSESGMKVYATSAVIGAPIVPGAKKTLAHLKLGDQLDKVPSWPVSISYFNPGDRQKDETPLYEMNYRFHDNGVTSSILIDYGEYAINAKLDELVYLDQGRCDAGAP